MVREKNEQNDDFTNGTMFALFWQRIPLGYIGVFAFQSGVAESNAFLFFFWSRRLEEFFGDFWEVD